MKHIAEPTIDDADLLTQIADNAALALRNHRGELPNILQQYKNYSAARGNAAAANAPVALPLPVGLKRLLKGYYKRPPDELAFIDQCRGSSTDVCPMCGGFNAATLDHIFPQRDFAEFAFMSRNLVPACSCNTLRRADYRGPNPGERVLHPYFDSRLSERLVRATIAAANGGFEDPAIGVEICIGPNDPLRPALQFHLDNVVLRTFVLRHLELNWAKLRRNPERYLMLAAGPISDLAMSGAVETKLTDTDLHFGTPNNWDSMFFAGISASAPAKQFLAQWVSALRVRPIRSHDV